MPFEKDKTYYTCSGKTSGDCNHHHADIEVAHHCLERVRKVFKRENKKYDRTIKAIENYKIRALSQSEKNQLKAFLAIAGSIQIPADY